MTHLLLYLRHQFLVLNMPKVYRRFLTSISGTYKWDLETWRANETGFIKFLAFVSNTFSPDYCIILSGDVHYAFTMKARFDIFSSWVSHKATGFDLENNIQTPSLFIHGPVDG